MKEAFICDAVRTPFGRYGGALKAFAPTIWAPCRCARHRAQHVGGLGRSGRRAVRLREPGRRGQPQCRAHVRAARGPAQGVPGSTINRLCGSGMDAVGSAARAIRAGDGELYLAGGVESMTRAPFVMGKATSAYSRSAESSTPPSAGASSTS